MATMVGAMATTIHIGMDIGITTITVRFTIIREARKLILAISKVRHHIILEVNFIVAVPADSMAVAEETTEAAEEDRT